MRKIALLDTSVMSCNLGDQIIMDGIKKGMDPVLKSAMIVYMPTHTPLFHGYQAVRKKDTLNRYFKSIDLIFACGTNLLRKNMLLRKPLWNIRMSDSRLLKNVVLVGVGTDSRIAIENRYTEKLYHRILSKEYIHSTRDERTKTFLENMGFQAINTGCPSMWSLAENTNIAIPQYKAETVVFTVTDYNTDPEKDTIMVNTLCEEYERVFCWTPGWRDMEYLDSLGLNKRIQIIDPSVEAYDKFLEETRCDYVGTRLHAGIRAMQKKRRTIIIGVDNRARDINNDSNLNYLERDLICGLRNLINTNIETRVNIKSKEIERFVNQFL